MTEHTRQRLITSLAACIPAMRARAIALDRQRAFPAEDFALLRQLGALAAPLPQARGGLGMGTEPAGALALMEVLRLLGRGNLSVGRLYEAHVNALRLIARIGSPAQLASAAEDARAGHLFALWVTDAPGAPLRLDADGTLAGSKFPCSGAGHATRALVTAITQSGTIQTGTTQTGTTQTGTTQMHSVAIPPGTPAALGGWDGHGMRACLNGAMDLTGLVAGVPVGQPGDYLRQPDFSAGAWRASAVTLGGIEALVGEWRATLLARGRDADPHQRARVGEALIAQETARMWVRRAALLGESEAGDAGDTANTVNLARLAVEAAALDVLRLAQRGLGLAAFRTGSTVELLLRDLAMYLRQPAPDETLTEAAAHFMARDLPAPP